MKNFILLCLQIGILVFSLGSVFSIINYLTGWHLGFKGAEVPGVPAAIISFLLLTGICVGLERLLSSKANQKG
jgi:hydrogenase/urease accessory protein HupE